MGNWCRYSFPYFPYSMNARPTTFTCLTDLPRPLNCLHVIPGESGYRGVYTPTIIALFSPRLLFDSADSHTVRDLVLHKADPDRPDMYMRKWMR